MELKLGMKAINKISRVTSEIVGIDIITGKVELRWQNGEVIQYDIDAVIDYYSRNKISNTWRVNFNYKRKTL